MIKKWRPDPIHLKILTELFKGIDAGQKYKILDAGSGRTSLLFLTKQFNKSAVTALIYPGDDRKKIGIQASVKESNYVLQEVDIHKFRQRSKFDIVLAHLLLGEAGKFSKKYFPEMLKSLFKIKTRYLAVIDILDDPDVDYRLLLKCISKKGNVVKTIFGGKYVAFLLELK